jgi:hypothetical protein
MSTTLTVSGVTGYTQIYLPLTTLSVTSTGYIQQGVYLGQHQKADYTVVNNGRIESTYSVGGINEFLGAGFITNGAVGDTAADITGLDSWGVNTELGTVTNFGAIIGNSTYDLSKGAFYEPGVKMLYGKVTNGSSADTVAQISGASGVFMGAAGTVSNFGQIIGTRTIGYQALGVLGDEYGSAGIYMGDRTEGPSGNTLHPGNLLITNGSASDTGASIQGVSGVYVKTAGAINNFGTIEANSGKSGKYGIYINSGTVTNGSTVDTAALVQGYKPAVEVGSGKIVNFGTLKSTMTAFLGVGASISGGLVVNGSAADQTALIEGYAGVAVGSAAGTVENFGVVKGEGGSSEGYGVAVYFGGVVTNGGIGDDSAVIEGNEGVSALFASAAVTNYGTIKSSSATTGLHGIFLGEGGAVTNGSTSDLSAYVRGYESAIEMAGHQGTVHNFGTIANVATVAGHAGISLNAGGYIENGSAGDLKAVIKGFGGVVANNAPATVVNFGSIESRSTTTGQHGVYLADGGKVTNGSTAAESAYVQGYQSAIEMKFASGTIDNFGTIANTATVAGHAGISLNAGGYIENGSATDLKALIKGYQGVVAQKAAATLVNFGTVKSTGLSSNRGAVALYDGGSVTNGASGDHTAYIMGREGVTVEGAAGFVTNFGVIASAIGGLSTNGKHGVLLDDGGTVTNGSATDESANISGYQSGVAVNSASGDVTNYGDIISIADASGQAGVYLTDGGNVTNGAGGADKARIEGDEGVVITSSLGIVNNYGSIEATGGLGAWAAKVSVGVASGGILLNEASGLIKGYEGADVTGALINDGTIMATGTDGFGAILADAGSYLRNGHLALQGENGGSGTPALIEGNIGLLVSGAGTVINFGSIVGGASGLAVAFFSPGGTLIVEPNCEFTGAVDGDGGTLVLNSGLNAGTISGLTGGDVTVSGAMPTTPFDGFDTIEIAGGAKFIMPGSGTISSGETLDVAGALTADGGLTVEGSIGGGGSLTFGGGTATFDSGASLTVADVTESGVSTVAAFETPALTYAGVWNQTSGTVSAVSGDRVNFSGVGDAFAGTLAGAGTIALTGGSDTLSGATLTAASAIVSGATVALVGAITLTDTLVATSPKIVIGAAGATLSGGGRLELTNASTNLVLGVSASATLTNGVVIFGAGDLGDGQMTLDNGAAGIIEGDDSVALTINTGTNAILNAGDMVAVTALTMDSAVDNTGELLADGGTLTAKGAVTGSGKVVISAGTADFASSFTGSVDFTGTTGELQLAQSKSYTGDITGFSLTGGTSLDLLDVAFAGTTSAVYTGTATSGVLTVTEGANVAKITLEGNYLSSTFKVSNDGHGGSLVVDPTKASASARPAVSTLAPESTASHALFAQTMAAYAPSAAHLDLGEAPHGLAPLVVGAPMFANPA